MGCLNCGCVLFCDLRNEGGEQGLSPMANGQNQKPAATLPGIASPWTWNVIPRNHRDASTVANCVGAGEMVIASPYLCHRPHHHIAALLAAVENRPVRCHCADPGHCNVTPNRSRRVHSHASGPNDDPPSQPNGCAIGCQTWSECDDASMCYVICSASCFCKEQRKSKVNFSN